MEFSEMKPGTNLCLDIYDESNKRIDREFISSVDEILNEYEATIEIPTVEGVVYAVRAGWKLVVYVREGNTIFRFLAKVLDRKIDSGRPIMKIIRTSIIDDVQRRKYFRLDCLIPVKYRIIEDVDADLNMEFKDGLAANLSGVGMSLRIKERVKTPGLIECQMEFEGTVLTLVGEIVRCLDKTTDEDYRGAYNYEIGVMFTEITDHEKDFIIRFIFEEQRRQIQQMNEI
ncbi:MAG: PilZ domain-containing protein [Oscillospiraceae bacterium]|nr:PilZ domain-containing protein [Oscillospiraceae bacterium]